MIYNLRIVKNLLKNEINLNKEIFTRKQFQKVSSPPYYNKYFILVTSVTTRPRRRLVNLLIVHTFYILSRLYIEMYFSNKQLIFICISELFVQDSLVDYFIFVTNTSF